MAITPSAYYVRDNSTINAAVFTASQSGTTLTVTAVTSGTLSVGMMVSYPSVAIVGLITALGTGTGGTGTYTLTNSSTIASDTFTGFTSIVTGSIGWSAVTPWAASTSYTVGTLRRQNALTAQVNASSSVGTMTVNSVQAGTLNVGQTIFYIGSTNSIASLGTGTGGTGTYLMNAGNSMTTQNVIASITPGNEKVFVCTVAGTSGATEPAWTLTRNSTTTDNTVTWREVTGQPPLNGDTTNAGIWTASASASNAATPGAVGTVIVNTAKTHVFIATAVGTTDVSEPTWATTTGSTTTDGTVTWVCLGPVGNFPAWSAPAAHLVGFLNTSYATAGTSIFLADDHNEIQQQAIGTTTIVSGTAAAPTYILSVNHTTVPPTSATLLSGATIATMGNSNLVLFASATAAYIYGLTLNAGTGASFAAMNVSAGKLTLNNCALARLSAGSGTITISSSNAMEALVINSSVKFGNVGDRIITAGNSRYQNFSVLGPTYPTTQLFNPSAGSLEISGSDLSVLGSNAIFIASGGTFLLSGCKLSSSPTIASFINSGQLYDLLNCDSAGSQYRRARYTSTGTLTTETTIVRTGGAQIEATSISDKIVTTANCSWAAPFVSIPISIRNPTTGSNVTVTVYGLAPAGLPTNDQVWLEVEYPGASSSPLTSFVSTTKTNPLATATNVTTDASTWGGSGTAFKLVATLTSPQPALAGSIMARVKVGAASYTVYIDPLVVLS